MRTLGIFELASQQARWLSVRQSTIAENIANANTPSYLARDVEPFRAVLDRAGPAMALTDPRHIAPASLKSGVKVDVEETVGSVSGGKVSVENELMKSAEVRRDYELNTSIVRAFHRMILTAAKG